ncbi:hypothetical protein [Kangiella koreensis]|uniref:ATPase n=1 Tax=Kangiella koreensis (strain DSM 16069 / JCM 12317 / KCTC 12182 / SW-125) TaxID=523791 RepID=C7RBT7_KANKD|nr:hypothetical protein [Kangiella koreensis]ACV26729.1 conserved hypothetical protein [Kangiella koreensis DSM 16069]
MNIKTLKDVLHWTSEFHQHLSNCLSHCAKNNKNIRAKLYLDYLAMHEMSLSKALNRSEIDSDIKALDTWCYEYLENHPIHRYSNCDRPFAELDIDEIITEILHINKQLIELYKNLSARTVAPSAQELLQNILELEEHDAMFMTKGFNRLNDL